MISGLIIKIKQIINDNDNNVNRFILLIASFFIVFYLILPAIITSYVGKPLTYVDWFQMPIKGGDYIATYAASNSLLDGHDMYFNNALLGDKYKDQFAGGQYSRYSYPPLQAFILAPFTFFSFETSYYIWSIVSSILTLISIFLISSLTRHKKIAFVFLTLFYALSSFFWFQIERGQTDTLLLLFMSVSIYLYLKKKNIVWAALFFSLAILLKVFPLAFALFFVLKKEYKLLVYTLLFSLLVILVTGFSNWTFWLSTVLPQYSNYYLGAEVDHSLAYLLSGFWDKSFIEIVKTSKIISVLLFVLYAIISFLNKNKNRSLVAIELTIISIIAGISTPWASNYKLVTLILLFATPFFILELKNVKNKVLLTIPLLFAFIFISPIYNEFYGRVLFSLFSVVTPNEFIVFQNIYKTAEFRVSLALLFCLFYLFSLQIYLLIRNRKLFKNIVLSIKANRRTIIAAVLILFFLFGSFFVYAKLNKYQQLKIAYLEKIRLYDNENKISDNISLAGYDIKKKINGSYEIELIIKVNKGINHHYAFYIHGYSLDPNPTVEGINFFPPILVNFWQPGKYIIINKTVNLTPKPQNIKFGLFDISDGGRHGKEIELGVVNLNELK